MPELVSELVSLGGAIHAVVPTRQTLEERFLSLLGPAPETSDEDAPTASREARP